MATTVNFNFLCRLSWQRATGNGQGEGGTRKGDGLATSANVQKMKTGQPHKTHPHSEHRQHSHPSVRIWGNEHAHGIEWAQGGGVAEGGDCCSCL